MLTSEEIARQANELAEQKLKDFTLNQKISDLSSLLSDLMRIIPTQLADFSAALTRLGMDVNKNRDVTLDNVDKIFKELENSKKDMDALFTKIREFQMSTTQKDVGEQLNGIIDRNNQNSMINQIERKFEEILSLITDKNKDNSLINLLVDKNKDNSLISIMLKEFNIIITKLNKKEDRRALITALVLGAIAVIELLDKFGVFDKVKTP